MVETDPTDTDKNEIVEVALIIIIKKTRTPEKKSYNNIIIINN
jgi:hypothetical protein